MNKLLLLISVLCINGIITKNINPPLTHIFVNKHQYLKPSIDGSWLANERSSLLRKAMGKTTTTTTTTTTPSTTTTSGYTFEGLKNNAYKILYTNLIERLVSALNTIQETLTVQKNVIDIIEAKSKRIE